MHKRSLIARTLHLIVYFACIAKVCDFPSAQVVDDPNLGGILQLFANNTLMFLPLLPHIPGCIKAAESWGKAISP